MRGSMRSPCRCPHQRDHALADGALMPAIRAVVVIGTEAREPLADTVQILEGR
jgi:hypothetical protein